MHYLVSRTEPKRFFLFFRVTYHTGREQRLPPFIFFGTARLFFRKKIFPQRVPPAFFLMFCDRMDVEKPQRVPLSVFRHCETLARHSVHFLSIFFEKIIFKKFRFSITVKEYLTLGSLLAIFEPWIWRRLGPVPACFRSSRLHFRYHHLHTIST